MFSAAIFYAGIAVEWGRGAPLSSQDPASRRKRAGMQAEQEQEQAIFLVDEAQLREEI
jgi:hypothetical protein